MEQDPKTGDVTVTPKKPDGSIYPPGTVVEIPGKDGKPITVTIGEDGKGKRYQTVNYQKVKFQEQVRLPNQENQLWKFQ